MVLLIRAKCSCGWSVKASSEQYLDIAVRAHQREGHDGKAPVAKVLLEADHAEVIRCGRHRDESMMFGFGETLFVRLSKACAAPQYTLNQLRDMLEVM